MNKEEKTGHIVTLNNRSLLKMTGIKEVLSFNNDKIILKSDQGGLIIAGEKLNIKKLNLDDSNIIIEGYITNIIYNDQKDRNSIFKKIFKKKNK